MDYKKFNNKYVVRLDKGEELVEELKKFCKDQKIKLGSISGLGATDKITIGLFDVKDKNVLLIDDMISTGSTMIKGTEKIKSCGAKRVCAAVVHGLFVFDSAAQISKTTDCVFSTDTIVTPQSQVSIKDELTTLT